MHVKDLSIVSLFPRLSDLNHEQDHKINVTSSRYTGAYSQRTQPFGSLYIKQWYRVFALSWWSAPP